ncbi:recombinase family protein [Burkholderia ubonensis]|uniref:recombinase family protein n=1 Tax=Burkholderia ubonensis TaxID=101571 RepID=UPI000F588F29|nr:recombinase family protein [Burkholderia ubonensis]RQP40102.1 recombinase family protein [Burkholderia ubonensis]RQP43689.1 recombinase family protein [Burkholderia ubonensis]RQP44439.1 recombinase family protein [Burkholderia ubonensis]RQP55631.1 recombinase family protein [Burkholderia ubonensis]RQP63936.1 recombinase family protein [Burkholderia ubonensis]
MIRKPKTWAYYRVSTKDQSIEMQRDVLSDRGAITFDHEEHDAGVSGVIPGAQRQGFGAVLRYINAGDALYVYALDRIGRDAIDVQTNVRDLLDKGVRLNVHGLGFIEPGQMGKLIVGIMAQLAEMQREKIVQAAKDGKDTAREFLARTGRTHKGKASLGRLPSVDHATLVAAFAELRRTGNVSTTAKNHGIKRTTLIRIRDSAAAWAEKARAEAGYVAEQGGMKAE